MDLRVEEAIAYERLETWADMVSRQFGRISTVTVPNVPTHMLYIRFNRGFPFIS